ncbi:MAG: prolipoprotein diacylglyceryl transferase [Lachnospiraceae bacterium]|jgi:phosphatidylglycerol:prolipoprotein diacylglycerol transferase|nr:prolipoprotein diacylglyceryl transferase [Lachnospiraceae bacterium]
MRPILFSIGPVNIYGYGLMIALGILVAFFVASKRAPKYDLIPDAVYNIGLVAAVSGLLGAKILFCIVEFQSFMADPVGILFSGNGFVVFGGLISGVLVCLWYCKKKEYDFFRYFDLIMPSIALAQGFGRIGCFLAGCCYGAETESAFSVTFHASQLAPNGVKLIPTQLMSSAGDFLIAFILIYMAKRIKRKGNIGALYIALYSVGRFIIEFFRADYRGSIGPLSTSQAISIVGVIVAAGFFVWNSKGQGNVVKGNSEEEAIDDVVLEDKEVTEDVD